MQITIEVDINSNDLGESERRVKVIQKILDCLKEYMSINYRIKREQ